MLMHSEDCGKFDGRDLRTLTWPHPAGKENQSGAAETRTGFRASRATCRGFSLVELLVSMVVLTVIMGGIVTTLASSQEAYGVSQMQSDMYEKVRGAAELMAQEIGQAGVVTLPAGVTIGGSGVTGSGTAQAVTVSSTTSMYSGTGTSGEAVLVDAGNTSEELVNITALTSTTMSGIFTKNHSNGAPVTVLGVFPSGIVPQGTTDGSTSNPGAAASTLNLFGDINADGSLVYVRYTCDTTSTPGTLTRSVTTITPGSSTISTAQSLLSTLIVNPSNTTYPTGVPCFIFTQLSVTVGSTTYTFVTNVGITLSVRSLKPDPHTSQYLTMTKSFLDLAPRNLLAGVELANAATSNSALTSRLQATPSNVTAY
jgi:prepilin-type N-terminal cleavage/methylation domain-containing protein